MSLPFAVGRRLRTAFVCLVLQVGLVTGVPVRPDEIEELLRRLNEPKLAHELRDEDDSGDPPR